ncbi:uncharacterized protein LOC100375851 [Saccoglossus kowalevskii]|uniref:Uncharacterized protein LOC100375851 n=1 Tax=Saccoglossus kowalevskii TaxID=10224 RepID=A0ABM0H1C4_SACKO|nr:PREDICTED: uncharacterized protein LOC100375851 [Saccoglossus kowalevskii]
MSAKRKEAFTNKVLNRLYPSEPLLQRTSLLNVDHAKMIEGPFEVKTSVKAKASQNTCSLVDNLHHSHRLYTVCMPPGGVSMVTEEGPCDDEDETSESSLSESEMTDRKRRKRKRRRGKFSKNVCCDTVRVSETTHSVNDSSKEETKLTKNQRRKKRKKKRHFFQRLEQGGKSKVNCVEFTYTPELKGEKSEVETTEEKIQELRTFLSNVWDVYITEAHLSRETAMVQQLETPFNRLLTSLSNTDSTAVTPMIKLRQSLSAGNEIDIQTWMKQVKEDSSLHEEEMSVFLLLIKYWIKMNHDSSATS